MMFMNTDNNHDNDGCDDNDNANDNDNCESHYANADDNESCRMRQLCSVSGQS